MKRNHIIGAADTFQVFCFAVIVIILLHHESVNNFQVQRDAQKEHHCVKLLHHQKVTLLFPILFILSIPPTTQSFTLSSFSPAHFKRHSYMLLKQTTPIIKLFLMCHINLKLFCIRLYFHFAVLHFICWTCF